MHLHPHAVRQLLWMWYSAASLFRFLLARSKLRKQHPHQGAEKRDAQLDLPISGSISRHIAAQREHLKQGVLFLRKNTGISR